jgi:hypothetical protein
LAAIADHRFSAELPRPTHNASASGRHTEAGYGTADARPCGRVIGHFAGPRAQLAGSSRKADDLFEETLAAQTIQKAA